MFFQETNQTFNVTWLETTNNSLPNVDVQYLLHSTTWTVIIILAYVIILLAGLVGNTLVILAYCCRPRMRTVTNLFIMNLAVADLMAVLVCFLGNLLSNTISPWILGWFMCKAVAYVQGVSICASAYLLAAISVDRCVAIFQSLARPKGLCKTKALYTIILIWILSLCLPVPWALKMNLAFEYDATYCREVWEVEVHGKIYFFFNFFAFYITPLTIIIIANLMTWCLVRRRELPGNTATSVYIHHMHHRTRQGARKMLSIVTLMFLISWLPLYAMVINRYFELSESEGQVLWVLLPFAQWLGSANSSINPLLYAFLNEKFREAFKSLLPSGLMSSENG